jgi:hypothetical protein
MWPFHKKEPETLTAALAVLKGRDPQLHRDVADSIRRHKRIGDPEKTFAEDPRWRRFWKGGNLNDDLEMGEILARELSRVFPDDMRPGAQVEQETGCYAVPLRDGRTARVSITIR